MLTKVTIALTLPLLLVNCDNDAGYFFELAKKFKDSIPSCQVPTLKNPIDIKATDDIWGELTKAERNIVKSCHSMVEPHCYNGFFKSINRGYADSFVDLICNGYRPKWEPCCNNTNPIAWEGPLKAYCPMYMGDCTGRSQGNSGAGKFDYSQRPDETKNKFGVMCPGYDTYCSTTDAKVKDAIRYIDLCYTLAGYARVENCDSLKAKEKKFAGCKKYHKYCKPIFD
uniref:Uncharacterized protein n=1 Tax=Romanomermis culicivorax TaxID=13658 RepID=A0A915KGQ0_ROMCU